MKSPKTEEEMYKIIDEWADLKECDDGDEMRYFASEILSIIKFTENKQ
jgi:hypothetical protein